MYKVLILTLVMSLHLFSKEIVVYVNSCMDTKVTIERWQPTIDLLNEKITTHRFKLLPLPPSEIELIQKLIDEEKIDLLITQPAIATTLIHNNEITPILTMVNQYMMSQFGSVFITKADNEKINKVKDIKGKTIAAVAPMSFGGWLVGYSELFDYGIDPVKDKKITFLDGSHKKVAQAVIDGKYDVGIIKTGMFESLRDKELIDPTKIKIISDKKLHNPIKYSTKLYPEWTLSRASHLDLHLMQDIFRVFVEIQPTDFAAVKGEYYHWHFPESYKDVDLLFKKLHLGHYEGMGGLDKRQLFYIFLVIAMLITIGVIVAFIRYRMLENNKKILRDRLAKTEEITHIAHWELDIENNKAHWSKEVLDMIGLDKMPEDSDNPEFLRGFMFEEYVPQCNESMQKIMHDHDHEHKLIFKILKVDTQEPRWLSCLGKYNKERDIVEGTLQDITEFKTTQDELEKQKELLLSQSKAAMMGEMISLIAHQWKQPLSILSMTGSSIKMDIEFDEIDPKTLLKATEDIDTQVQYLSETIDTFRDFLKPIQTKKEIVVEEALEKSLKIVNKSLLNNDIELLKEFSTTSKVLISPSELMQVVINLINNSKDAFKINSIKDRKIWIKAYEDKKSIIIEIEDTAGGIPKESIDKVFNAYYTTKSKELGTGLGLYIVKTIVEDHFNGTVEIENTSSGVKFTITLPI